MSEVSAESRAEAVVDALGLLYHDDLDPEEFMLFPQDSGAVIETDAEVSDWQGTDGGRAAFECLVRTILSQNTSDAASKPAHESLLERFDSPDGDLAESLAERATTVTKEADELEEAAEKLNQTAAKLDNAAERLEEVQ